MGKIGKAHVEAMKALQQAKEKPEIAEDVVENIKNTHQEFMGTPNESGQDTLPPLSSEKHPQRRNATNASVPQSPQPYKRKLTWVLGSMAAIILLSGIGYTVHSNQHVSVVYDTIDMRNDFLINRESKLISTRDFLLIYPTRVKDYDMTGFYKELFGRYLLESHLIDDKKTLTEEANNLDFKEAARKIAQADEDYLDDYNMYIHCSYDETRGWLSVSALETTCPTIYCYFESAFFYSLEKQKALTFDDIFLPEKEEQLMELIQERILSKPSMPEELTRKNWKPVIIGYDLVKEDSVWCWQIDCRTEPDLELPRTYYPLRATIAEKSLAEYLSYPVPQE